jgi:hypothetical protein
MSYLHDETNGADGGALRRHLGECADCRAQVAAWQETRRRLDTWKLAPRQRRNAVLFAWPRFAAAAAAAVVLLAAGLAVGRITAPSRSEIVSLRAELEAMKAGMQTQIELAAQAESRTLMREFATALSSHLQAIRAEHVSDYATLRRELQTVALLTEAGFSQAESRFVTLANANQSEANQ